jgi:hypothetical protein
MIRIIAVTPSALLWSIIRRCPVRDVDLPTGARGETIIDVLAAVLREEPPWGRVPIRVRRLLHARLQKDPTLQLRAIGD